MSIEAMKQALEACQLIVSAFDALKPAAAARTEPLQINAAREAITALRTAIAEAEKQEPVAWANINKHGDITHTNNKRMPWSKTPLYTTPPAAQQKPLTEEEIADIWDEQLFYITDMSLAIDFVRDIEAAHGITGEKPNAS